MKRFILFAIVSTLVLSPVFGDSYRDALMYYLYNGDVNAEQYKTTLGEALAKSMPEGTDPNKAAQIMSEYASKQMFEDIVDLFQPVFEKHVSENELKQVGQLYRDERFVALQNKSTAIIQNIASDEEYLSFMNSFSTALGNIITGQQVQDLPEPETLSDSYKQTFYQYYTSSGIDKMMDGVFNSVFTMLSNSLRSQGQPNADEIVGKAKTYTATNMRTMMLVIFSKAYTEDDINYVVKATDTDAYRHCVAATSEVLGDTMNFVVSLFDKMSAWLRVNYPQYGAAFDDIIKQLRALM